MNKSTDGPRKRASPNPSPGDDGRALVAVPKERLEEAAQAIPADITDDHADDDTPVAAGDVTDDGRSEARALIGYLERRVEELTDDLADTRNELRTARFEADTLRVQAGRADVLVALVETERARTAEIRTEMTVRIDIGQALLEGMQAERDRLLVEVKDRRQSWVGRLVGQLRGQVRKPAVNHSAPWCPRRPRASRRLSGSGEAAFVLASPGRRSSRDAAMRHLRCHARHGCRM